MVYSASALWWAIDMHQAGILLLIWQIWPGSSTLQVEDRGSQKKVTGLAQVERSRNCSIRRDTCIVYSDGQTQNEPDKVEYRFIMIHTDSILTEDQLGPLGNQERRSKNTYHGWRHEHRKVSLFMLVTRMIQATCNTLSVLPVLQMPWIRQVSSRLCYSETRWVLKLAYMQPTYLF